MLTTKERTGPVPAGGDPGTTEEDAEHVDDGRARVIGAILVTILVDGALVEGSTSAQLRDNVVVAPVSPYLRSLADRIQIDDERGSIVVERGGRSVSLAIGSPLLRDGSLTTTLPVAPYLGAGEALIPLAAVARALGVSVVFDPASKTLSIASVPVPLATLTPDVSYTPPAQPLATFTPNPTPAPRVTVTGIPQPRRTPILVETGDS